MSASACINNVGVSPESFIDWLSPRISFSRDFAGGEEKNECEKADPEGSGKDFAGFEFRLDDDPVKMLPADELFSDGKLIPRQLAPMRAAKGCSPADASSPAPVNLWRRVEINGPDLCAFSPKAPRCSSRWKELLGLKKAQQNDASTAASKGRSNASRSMKLFPRRNGRSSSIDSSPLNLPLLRDSDSESASISARASLSSSSSSGADPEDLPRFSLDSEKINGTPVSLRHNPQRHRVVANGRSMKIRRPPALLPAEGNRAARVSESAADGRIAGRGGRSPVRRTRDSGDLPPPRGSSVDSPRLNASGKVIFQGLERSSSSPSTFNGGLRPRLRGMERSYSANVMVTPVLNVPVCTLRGSAKSIAVFDFGQIFSPQKKEKEGSSAAKHGVGKTKGEKSSPRN